MGRTRSVEKENSDQEGLIYYNSLFYFPSQSVIMREIVHIQAGHCGNLVGAKVRSSLLPPKSKKAVCAMQSNCKLLLKPAEMSKRLIIFHNYS